MPSETLTYDYIVTLCKRVFTERPNQTVVELKPLASRQHEMVSFELWWYTEDGVTEHEELIARRYVSTISWWRPDDRGKAQREATVIRWLGQNGFPVPEVYAREFGPDGDVALFSRLKNDFSLETGSFRKRITPYIEPFAKALADLHSLTPADEVRRVLPWVTLPGALANLMALASQLGLRQLEQAVERTMVRSYDVQELEPVTIHGDYHFLNALLHEGEISGIIDWEYCALGDPRWDVANVYAQLVDYGASGAANTFLEIYLEQSGRVFDGPPIYNVVAPLQQWAISEWVVRRDEAKQVPSFELAEDLVALRDTHKRRAMNALAMLG
jgi:hypothetical protein